MANKRYCLYIDESGVPELSANSEFCAFTGVLIPEEDEKSFLFLIENIKKKYKLDFNKHIHAVDIFEKPHKKCYLGKTPRRPSKDLRKEFQASVWDLIRKYDLQYYVVVVSKSLVKKVLRLNKKADKGKLWISSSNYYARADRQLPMDVGINALYHWGLKKLGKEDTLKVIFEARSGDQFTIRNYIYVQSENVFKNGLMKNFCSLIKEKIVSISFANKNVRSVGLELSDLICYTCNVYMLQIKKKTNKVDKTLKNAISFVGIHKTLNKKHYIELTERAIRKYTPGLNSRTERIEKKYNKDNLHHSLSPAKAEAQIS